jgi:thiazole synthase
MDDRIWDGYSKSCQHTHHSGKRLSAVFADTGVGTGADAAVAMELGRDAVLMNTGIACASDSIAMAEAMKFAVQAGRLAHKAGRIPQKLYASASRPLQRISQ